MAFLYVERQRNRAEVRTVQSDWTLRVSADLIIDAAVTNDYVVVQSEGAIEAGGIKPLFTQER